MLTSVSLFPIFDYIVSGIKTVVNWLLDLVYRNIPSASSIRNLLPENCFSFSSVLDGSSLAYLDLWFPVDYAVGCFIAYVSISCVVFLINWIVGLIPGVH